MHIFHDWGKWSEQKFGKFHSPYNPITQQNSFDFEACYQDRTCNKCGVYQWRKL